MADIQDLQKIFDQIKQGLNLDELQEFNDLIKKVESSLAGFGGDPIEALEKLQNSVDAAAAKTKKLADETERAKKVSGDFDSALQKTIKTFTGVTDTSDSLIGSFMNLAKEEKGLEKGFKQLGKTVKKTLTPFNILSSTIAKVAEGSVALALANDKAIASFNGATGAGGRFNKQILALEKSNRRFGIGAAEAGNALQGLIGGLSGFGLMASDTQTALADEVAELTKLGATAGDVTGVFQSATKTFGMTTDAAVELNQEAETLAQELGISLNQAVGDLNRALPQLAVLSGDKVADAFERLSEQAVETGMSIDQLTSIADRFMTFEQAGKAASNLNAVLGTQMFDTMSLLEAQLEGPQAFIDTFRDQLQGSVGDFDSLTVFQKQAIANASGLSVVEVRNLMNAEQMTEEQKEQAQEREKNLKATMDLFAELKAVAMQLTIALTPVINGIKTVLDYTGRFLGFLGKAPGLFGVIAQVVTLTLIPTLIKTVVQLALQKTTLAIVGRQIQQNTMYQRMFNAEVARGNMMQGRGNMIQGRMGNPGTQGMIQGTVKSGARRGLSKVRLGGMGAMGVGLGGSLLGAGIGSFSKEEGDFADRAGGAVSGAATGAMIGSVVPVVGTAAGAIIGGIGGALGFLADGTDDYDGKPLLNVKGEAGEELTIPPPGSAIINNENTKTLAKMMGSGGGSDQAVVTAINSVGTKIDALMQRLGAPGDFVLEVNRREFARLTNEHFGAPGSAPATGA